MQEILLKFEKCIHAQKKCANSESVENQEKRRAIKKVFTVLKKIGTESFFFYIKTKGNCAHIKRALTNDISFP